MKDIILKRSLPENTLNEWVMSMAFIARPVKDILATVAQLFKKNHLTQMYTRNFTLNSSFIYTL